MSARPLEYAAPAVRSAQPTEDEACLVSGTLGLIAGAAAIALVGLGGVLRPEGGIDRVVGEMLMSLAVLPGTLGMMPAGASFWRANHLRSLGTGGILLTLICCAAGAWLLLR